MSDAIYWYILTLSSVYFLRLPPIFAVSAGVDMHVFIAHDLFLSFSRYGPAVGHAATRHAATALF